MTQSAISSSQSKIKVAVLYGGQSGEHEVSLMSAASVMEELDGDRYEVTPVFIGKDGRWSVPLESLREFDAVLAVNLDHRRRQMQRNIKVLQTLDDIAVEPIGMGQEFKDPDHLHPFQCQATRHDQADVP